MVRRCIVARSRTDARRDNLPSASPAAPQRRMLAKTMSRSARPCLLIRDTLRRILGLPPAETAARTVTAVTNAKARTCSDWSCLIHFPIRSKVHSGKVSVLRAPAYAAASPCGVCYGVSRGDGQKSLRSDRHLESNSTLRCRTSNRVSGTPKGSATPRLKRSCFTKRSTPAVVTGADFDQQLLAPLPAAALCWHRFRHVQLPNHPLAAATHAHSNGLRADQGLTTRRCAAKAGVG